MNKEEIFLYEKEKLKQVIEIINKQLNKQKIILKNKNILL